MKPPNAYIKMIVVSAQIRTQRFHYRGRKYYNTDICLINRGVCGGFSSVLSTRHILMLQPHWTIRFVLHVPTMCSVRTAQ